MLIANTDLEAKQLIELYDADPGRVEVVHPGVDLSVFVPRPQQAARARLGIPADALVPLFVGRIQPLKAPDILLRAVALLLERDPGLRSPAPRAGRRRPVRLRPRAPRGAGHARRLARHRRRGPLRAAGLARGARRLVRRGDAGRACRPTTSPSAWSRSRPQPSVRRWSPPPWAGSTTVVRDGVTGLLVDGHDPGRLRPRDRAAGRRPAYREPARPPPPPSTRRGFAWERTADETLAVYHKAARVAPARPGRPADLAGTSPDGRARPGRRGRALAPSRRRPGVGGARRRGLHRDAAGGEEAADAVPPRRRARTRSRCTRSSRATPTRTTSGSTAGCSSATSSCSASRSPSTTLGDIYLDGRLPLAAVTPEEIDRLLGAVLTYADESFNTILELGFASSIRKEWEWRVSRGESTRNLEAFRGWLECPDAAPDS